MDVNSASTSASHCHDATYSGSEQMQSFFTSFGTTWHWHADSGGSKQYGMSATTRDVRDKPHARSVLRSRFMVLTPNTSFSVATIGGKGSCASVEGKSARATGETTASGFLGVAVQVVSAGQWVLSKRRSSSSKDVELLTFTADELAPYVGQTVTVDVVDTHHGRWGWICAKSLLVQGTCQAAALGAELSRLHASLTAESQRAERLELVLQAERATSATLDAQAMQLREQLKEAQAAPVTAASPEDHDQTATNAQRDASVEGTWSCPLPGCGPRACPHGDVAAQKDGEPSAREAYLQARVDELEAALASSQRERVKASDSDEENAARHKQEVSSMSREEEDLRLRIQDLQARLARSESSAASLRSAASRTADHLQAQATKVRDLEDRLRGGEGYVVWAALGVARGMNRFTRCMRPSSSRTAQRDAPSELSRLQADVG